MEASRSLQIAGVFAQLRRIGLDPDELTGLATEGDDLQELIAHLRTLEPGASWADAFPGTRAEVDEPLGPFDYPDPPRGPAIFASLASEGALEVGTRAIESVRSVGVAIFGSGVILDRGAPHLYVVLPRGASENDVFAVVEHLRAQPGVRNAFPWRGGAAV